MLTQPVSRHLSVADLDRSIRFYRDVLGFDAKPMARGDGLPAVAEVVSGPARIQLDTAESAVDSTGERRPRGQGVRFFETDDVAALRQAVVARGGTPSELVKVNWIKYQVFQLHDPDGHTLWFAQSFQEPQPPAPPPQLRTILPELPLDDVAAGVAHYRDVLGFHVNYAQENLGVMDRDQVTVLLIARTERHTGIGSAYVYVANADALHAELSATGARIQGQPVSHPWGLRDFAVLDPEGNRITFGQPFE